jgi:hypothetical protein
MALMPTPLPRGLSRIEFQDGYEQGGLVYFRMNGKEMVLVLRERQEFDRALKNGTSLQDYCNSTLSHVAYDAARSIEALIPKVE